MLCGPQSSEKPPTVPSKGWGKFLEQHGVHKGRNKSLESIYVGKGGFLPWSEFNIPNSYVCPTLNTVAKRTPHISFNMVKARRSSEPLPDPLPVVESQSQSTVDDGSSDSEDESSLFFCWEEGCTRSFRQFSSLQKYLDYGSHNYALEYKLSTTGNVGLHCQAGARCYCRSSRNTNCWYPLTCRTTTWIGSSEGVGLEVDETTKATVRETEKVPTGCLSNRWVHWSQSRTSFGSKINEDVKEFRW